MRFIEDESTFCLRFVCVLSFYFWVFSSGSGLEQKKCMTFVNFCWFSFHPAVFVLSGAGPHPRAVSGRVICCSWWIFSIVLLACYFSNLSSSKSSDTTHLTVKGFDDLANQDMIEYGCLAGSSTLAFFKVGTSGHL